MTSDSSSLKCRWSCLANAAAQHSKCTITTIEDNYSNTACGSIYPAVRGSAARTENVVQRDAALYHTLQAACDRQLEITLEHAGTVPHDESVQRAIQTQRSVAEADPQSHAARAFRALWVRRPMEPAK